MKQVYSPFQKHYRNQAIRISRHGHRFWLTALIARWLAQVGL